MWFWRYSYLCCSLWQSFFVVSQLLGKWGLAHKVLWVLYCFIRFNEVVEVCWRTSLFVATKAGSLFFCFFGGGGGTCVIITRREHFLYALSSNSEFGIFYFLGSVDTGLYRDCWCWTSRWFQCYCLAISNADNVFFAFLLFCAWISFGFGSSVPALAAERLKI